MKRPALDTPQKVIDKAIQLGLHNDCVAAGPDKACKECIDTFELAFDFFYGHLPADQISSAIAYDLAVESGYADHGNG